MNLKEFPFFLNDAAIDWVMETARRMTLEEKIGQLFCLTPGNVDAFPAEVKKYHPGAIMHRPASVEALRSINRAAQEASNVPLLIAANLESGGNGITAQGTYFAKQMQIAATGSTEQAHRLGYVCAMEGAAAGCNWNFGPIIDLDLNWRNPITNVRSFGSNAETVKEMALAYVQGMKDTGQAIISCIKHFPGDGVDERDQHLTATVNSLSASKWHKTYGRVWKALIKQGALTAMAGHILQPALCCEIDPKMKPQDMLPASTSKELIQGVLRDELGFQGMLVTDATPMVGYQALRSRAESIQLSIAAGVDMILFTKNIDEDYQAVRDGLENGMITAQRLEEAVTRILAVKAAMGLNEKKDEAAPIDCLQCEKHVAWARECADQAVTLVKDNQGLLPLSPEKTPRVRLIVMGEEMDGSFSDNDTVGNTLKRALEKEGFSVAVYNRSTMENGEIFTCGVADLKEKFDLAIVAANVGTGSNHTTRRLDWITLMAADAPWYVRDIPTMLVSFANPYHLADAPYISTSVNCYSSNRYCVEAFVEKAMGRSLFVGQSPVDAFCGMKDAEML